MPDLVLDFHDPDAAEPRHAGGKGASLARLAQGGFPVPEGVIVTAAGYRAFSASMPELPGLAARLDVGDPERLRVQCRELRERLLEQPLPAELQAELLHRLPPLLGDGAVAVRSSATLEDLAGAAFAGQHDTYLGICGLEDVLDAVRRCFASLWEDRAVRYRRERGFGGLEADMAVVVQRMVDADVAGVAFSMHPVTGELDRVVVNAAPGLGETVVSGEGGIDQFVLEKASGRVLERALAEKTHALRQTDAGPALVELTPDERSAPSLDDVQLAALAALVARVERFYGFPQDVEWALAGERLHLLQSRPVTRFPARWTRAESAERFPNPVTPLTWDFTTGGFHESLAHSLALMGLPPFEGRWFERLGGYIYGNETAVRLFTAEAPLAFESLDELAALVPRLRERYRWVQELPVRWARDLDRYLLRLGRFGAVPLAGLSDAELWRHVQEVDALGREYFLPNIAISITQAQLHRLLYRIVRLAAGPERAPALYDRLTAFCETKTSLVNADLYGLYREATSAPDLARLLRETDRRRLWEDGLLERFPHFLAAFRRYLEDHGHREVDFDAYHPTWAGQPWVVLENLRLMLEQGDVGDPAEREVELRARQQEAERELLSLVPDGARNFVAELLRLTRAYTALDDLEHYQTTRLTIPFRAALVALGERFVGRGILAEPEDIFFLRRETIAGIVDGTVDQGDAAAEAASAKAEYLAQRAAPPPHVWGEESTAPAADHALRGLPGSAGVAEGPACIVRGVEDFARFRPGSVLVAPTTNPAWTPLFYSAVAVVAESGGPLSHGAVTAREVGIPAVMGVRGVLAALRDGDRVRVDGARGIVSRI